MTAVLDELERRIFGALQIDGRAPWRRIATVLGEAERTVARRGNELLSSGTVAVVGQQLRPEPVLMRINCAPGTTRMTTEALAQRADCNFAYMMTGTSDCVAELMFDAGRLGPVLATEIPATVGLVSASSYPVLRYFRTIRGWRIGALDPSQASALQNETTREYRELTFTGSTTEQDRRIADVLRENGRASIEEIARRAGISETTASRRTDWLLRHGNIHITALVEPARVGLASESMLWIRAAPRDVQRIGRELSSVPEVRYAAALAGDYQLVANVTLPDSDALYRFTTESSWAAHARGIESTVLLHARKRGGRMMPPA